MLQLSDLYNLYGDCYAALNNNVPVSNFVKISCETKDKYYTS